MYSNSNSDSQLSKVMTNEQFNQVVDAILSGKYSWACLLILRFSGYNPLHYIPYRTYNRLMKTNCEPKVQQLSSARVKSALGTKLSQKSTRKLKDLYHLEEVDIQAANIKGGKAKLHEEVISRWWAS